METISKSRPLFWKEARQVMTIVFWLIVILTVIFLISYHSLGDNPRKNIRIWYFAGIFSYIVIGAALIIKTNFDHFKFLFFINFLAIFLLIIGFVLHFFIAFPLPLQVILGWPALASVILFSFLTIMALLSS